MVQPAVKKPTIVVVDDSLELDVVPDVPPVVDAPAADSPPTGVEGDPAAVTVEPPKWRYETIEFLGRTIEVRKPKSHSLAALHLGTTEHVSDAVRAKMTGMFLNRHLSPDSYDYVWDRLMDPDDEECTDATLSNLVQALAGLIGNAKP